MRFESQISESYNTAQKTWNMVQRKCQPFLREWLPIFKTGGGLQKELFLWRGSETINNDYGMKAVRQKRVPMTTKLDIHHDVDNMMYKIHKVHGRSKTIFCTGSRDLAEGYGEGFMVFPMGNYKYIWSPKVDDLFVYLSRTSSGYRYSPERDVDLELHKLGYDRELDYTKRESKAKEIRERILKDNEKALEKIIKSYKTTGLNEVIRGKHEVAVQCKSYIYFSYRWYDEVAEWAWDLVR